MITNIILYPDTNSVEVTWGELVPLPDLVIPELPAVPALYDETGELVQEAAPAVPERVEIGRTRLEILRCHSYSQDQMDMLAADLGADLAEYQWIIDEVQANMIPEPVPDPAIVKAQKITELKAELAAFDIKRIRPTAEGDTAYLATLNAQAVTLRAELQALL